MTQPSPHPPDVAPNDRQFSVRFPLDLIARIDALQARLEQHPQFGALGVSRNGVVKMIVQRGLGVLEEELGATVLPSAFLEDVTSFADGIEERRTHDAHWDVFARQHPRWTEDGGGLVPALHSDARQHFARVLRGRGIPDG